MRYFTVTLLLLTACATPLTPQQYADALISTYGTVCEAIGFKAQSESWANCIIQHRQMAIASQQARAAGFSAITGASAEMRRATTLQPPR